MLDGEPARALADLERAEAIHARIYAGEHMDRWLIAGSKARCLFMLGRRDEAAAIIAALGPKLAAALPAEHLRRQELELVQAELALVDGDVTAAHERVAAVLAERQAAVERYPYGVAEAALLLARIEFARGRTAAARALLAQAEAAFASERLPAAPAGERLRLRQALSGRSEGRNRRQG